MKRSQVIMVAIVALVCGMRLTTQSHPGQRSPASLTKPSRARGKTTLKRLTGPESERESTPASAAQAERIAAERATERGQFLADKAQRIALRESEKTRWPNGTRFESDATAYTSLPQISAVKDNPGARPVLRRLGPYFLIPISDNVPPTSDPRLTSFDARNPPVVRAESSGRLGVVTGQYNISLKSIQGFSPEDFASEHGLEVTQSVLHIHRVFLQARAGTSLLATLEKLRADPLVESAELDVFDTPPIAR